MHRSLILASCVAAVALGICSCGGSDNTASGRVRIFYAYGTDGGTGQPIDVYPSVPQEFTSNTQPAGTKPLIAGLAYGQMSDYVTVFKRPNQTGQLSFYRAGKSDDANCIFGCTPPSAFVPGDQATIFVYGTTDTMGTWSTSFRTVYEHGKREMPGPDAGFGLVVGESLADATFGAIGWDVTGGPQPECLPLIDGSSNINGGHAFDFSPPSAPVTVFNGNCNQLNFITGPTNVPVTLGGRTYAIAYGYTPSTIIIGNAAIP